MYANMIKIGISVQPTVSSEHGDVNIKFLHPTGPAAKFFWPQHNISVASLLRMCTEKLIHLQLEVLDGYTVLIRRQ